MLRRSVVFLILLALGAAAAHADYAPTETAFPGWRISSCEDAYANPSLANGVKRYPLTNLVDGDPRTAWVFEGPKWDGKGNDQGYQAWVTQHAFQGGVDQGIIVESLGDEPFLVDAVGIINGYAKDAATYQRNNRIRGICIEATTGSADQLLWQKPTPPQRATLRSTQAVQVIPFPARRARAVRIVVEKVDAGRDNDLCISELQLYYQGRPLLPKPTPYVLYHTGSECGDGNALHLLAKSGRPALGGKPLAEVFGSYRFLGDHLAVVQTQDKSTVLDLTTGKPHHSPTHVGK